MTFLASVRRRLPARRKRSPPALPPSAYMAIGAGLLALLLGLMIAYGRPLLPDGGFALVGPSVGSSGSSALFDWYTLLHVVYGMGLRLLMIATSSHWPRGWLVLVALAASAVWEGVENLPPLARTFTPSRAFGALDHSLIANAFSCVPTFQFFPFVHIPGFERVPIGGDLRLNGRF